MPIRAMTTHPPDLSSRLRSRYSSTVPPSAVPPRTAQGEPPFQSRSPYDPGYDPASYGSHNGSNGSDYHPDYDPSYAPGYGSGYDLGEASASGAIADVQDAPARAPVFSRLRGLLLPALSVMLLAASGVLGGLSQSWQASTPAPNLPCSTPPTPNNQVSREMLLEFLTIPERQAAAPVQELLKEPYCQLPAMELRAGVTAERSLYALEFDAQTWLVVLYEEEEYAGYAFRVVP